MAATILADDLPTEETPLVAQAHASDDEAHTPVSFGRGLAITLSMGLLIFIQTTNMSMMTTAQSAIAADLDAFAEATWFSSAYLIAMSSMTPLAGRLSEIFTPRIYVLFSSAILSLGLFVSAAARSLAVFLLGRAIAGCGSGGLMSTSFILVLDLTSKKRRGLCIGLINAGYTTGVASGAILAGLLTPVFGWRLMFWVQAPTALILGPLLFAAIPTLFDNGSTERSTESLLRKLTRIDYAGALTLTASVVLLLYSLASPEISIMPMILSMVVFTGFLVIESRLAAEPIIPVAVLKSRSVLFTCAAGLGLMMARWSVLFYTPVYAMAVRGWSPASAGLILVPTNFGFGLGGLLVGWAHIRKAGSYYFSSIVLFVLFVVAILVLALLSTPSSPTTAYVTATLFNGFCAGALLNYTLAHVLHLTNPESHYIVSALVAMSRGFAGSFGSAIGGGLFSRVLKRSLENGFVEHGMPGRDELIRKLLGSPVLVMHLEGVEKEIAVRGYERATRMLFLAGGIVALASTVLQAGTGNSEGKKNRDDD